METLQWIGYRTGVNQALSWPRTGANCGDKRPSQTAIPREVELATFDLANALLGDPMLLRNHATTTALVPGIPNRDLRRIRLDVMEVEWRTQIGNSTTKAVTPLTVLPHLATILGCLTTSQTHGGLGSLVSIARS